jgi:hypothetical protein
MNVLPLQEIFRTAALGEEMRMFEFRYKVGYANGLLLLNAMGEPYATLTINMPDERVGKDEFIIKNYSENEDLALSMFFRGIFIDTGRRIPTGFVIVPVWKLLRKRAENMPTFEVYYSKDPRLSMSGEQEISFDQLNKTHVALLSLKASNKDEVYQIMQGEIWSPKGQARRLINSKGLLHTSMSVGDVVKEFTPTGSILWKAKLSGWEEVE